MATNLPIETESKFCFECTVNRKSVAGVKVTCFCFKKITVDEQIMEPYIGVSYKLSKSENFDEYMKAVGVGLMIRKLGNTLSPTVKLTGPVDGTYTLHTVSTFKNHNMTFKPGVEFDEETVDGRKVKSVVTFENNKMVQIQKDQKITSKIIREFEKEQMKAVFTVGDITSTRLYEKVN